MCKKFVAVMVMVEADGNLLVSFFERVMEAHFRTDGMIKAG